MLTRIKAKIDLSNLLYYSIALYICTLCLPFLAANVTIFNTLVILSTVLFVVGIIVNGRIVRYTMVLIILIFVFDFFIFKTQWSVYTTLSNKLLLLYEFWFPVIIGIELFSNRIYNQQKIYRLLILFLIVYSITCVTTIIGNINYDIPSRWLATTKLNSDMSYKYRSENIGGFGFCYLTLFVSILIIDMYKRNGNRILLIPLFCSYLCALFSQYFILIFLVVIMNIFICLEKMSNKKRIIFIVLTIICIVLLFLFLDSIFLWLISVTKDQEALQRRIQELYYSISLDLHNNMYNSSDIMMRQEVYGQSWDLFTSNPLIGGWYNSNIGRHSEIIDLLGSMGIVGLTLLSLIAFSIWKGLKLFYMRLQAKSQKTIIISYITVIILATFNPILSSREIGLALILPCIFVVMNTRDEPESDTYAKSIINA